MSRTIQIHNADKAVTAKTFKGETHLLVSSSFLTIQGEGPFAGRAAVFLRLAGCNFGAKTSFCQFCDTSFQLDRATRLTVSEVVNLLLTLRKDRQDTILVITGGEPTLQPLILDVLLALESNEATFDIYQFESNGTNPEFAKQLAMLPEQVKGKVSFGVSPKTNYRTGKCAVPPDEIVQLLELTGFLKFVVSADPESPHHEIPEWVFPLMEGTMIPVYVSPMAVYKRSPESEVVSAWDSTLVDHDETSKNYAYAAEYVLKHSGLMLSIQSHLFCNVA